MSELLKQTIAQLEAMDFPQLRQVAKGHYGVNWLRTDRKEDIISKIVSVLQVGEFARMANGDLAPGWARIKLHPVANIPDTPRPINHNGYDAWLPVNVEIDVPIKITEPGGVLRCAQDFSPGTNQGSEEYKTDIANFQDAIPFSVLKVNPGPDPRPGREVHISNVRRDKMDYRDEFGYWPSNEEVKIWKDQQVKHLLEDKRSSK